MMITNAEVQTAAPSVLEQLRAKVFNMLTVDDFKDLIRWLAANHSKSEDPCVTLDYARAHLSRLRVQTRELDFTYWQEIMSLADYSKQFRDFTRAVIATIHLNMARLQLDTLQSFLVDLPSTIFGLNFRFCNLEKKGLELVCQHLPERITHLDLQANYLQAGQLAALPTTITSLNLAGNRMGPSCITTLPTQLLANLTSLNLRGVRIGDEGALLLAHIPGLELQHLDLAHNNIGPSGFTALGGTNLLGQLVGFDVCGNKLGPESTPVIAGSLSPSLQHLNLAYNPLSNGFDAFIKRGLPLGLHCLDLTKTGLSSDQIKNLAQAQLPSQLTDLLLGSNAIKTDSALALIRRLPKGIRRLDLSNNHLDEEVSRTIIASSFFPNLRFLRLDGNRLISQQIVDDIQRQIAKSICETSAK